MTELEDYFTNVTRRDLPPLLPDPEPQPRLYPIISVDDHIVEPATMFTGRVPKRFGDRIPRIVETEAGVQCWQLGDRRIPMLLQMSSVVGRPFADWTLDPIRFDEMKPGAYDIHARIKDMDLAGIAATLCFPSILFGFCGQHVHELVSVDPELGIACMRAYNDWVEEEWGGPYPDRVIKQQITWLPDPEVAAGEVRRNAERGFAAVTFSENPQRLGYPSIHTHHWDEFFRACDETGTVLNLHVGSSSQMIEPSTDTPPDAQMALFTLNAMMAAVDWVYSNVAFKFPNLKITMSESGISWIPTILERLDRGHHKRDDGMRWPAGAPSPAELLLQHFSFTSLDDPSGMELRHMIGVENIMVESDYPHADTNWPDTQTHLAAQLVGVPHDEAVQMTALNASKLYRLPVPALN